MNDSVEVPLAALQFGLSPRAEKYDPEHVTALVEVLGKVPPILVHAPTMRVIDGVHRVMAARSAGWTAIPAVLFDGDETEARIEAVRTNVAHGKPLSLAEREAAAVGILELVPDWSNRRVASVTGLSPKTVGRLRARATGDSAQLRAGSAGGDADQGGRSRYRVGRDGKRRPVDPVAVRQRVAEALRDDPDASIRAIARRTGASQATVRDVRDRLERGVSEVASLAERRRKRSLPASSSMPEPGLAGVVPGEFAQWFETHHVEDKDWKEFVDTIPISRVYEIADMARQRSESWRAFASALEDRARGRRRSNG
jgi:ParB-like chromosome segregation protein Spo0J